MYFNGGLKSLSLKDLDGYAAIGRIPVVSASGKHLMPCKPAKARKLLEAGKAVERRSEDGCFYIQLKFDPSSPIVHPPDGAKLNYVFDSSYLAEIRQEAKRKRVWRKCLRKIDRDVVNLTIKCVDQPKSPKLIDAIAKIIVRVKGALMSPLYRLMEQVGRPLAKKLSRIAKSWGNETADKWVEDQGFVKYLTIMDKAFQGSV
jgi:hypothetical protein